MATIQDARFYGVIQLRQSLVYGKRIRYCSYFTIGDMPIIADCTKLQPTARSNISQLSIKKSNYSRGDYAFHNGYLSGAIQLRYQ
jgi:hypothetical protein